MVYFYTKHIESPEVEIYFELDEKGFANRQINIEKDNIEISCFGECLAEMNCFECFQEDILDRQKYKNEEIFTYDDLLKYKDILENKGTLFITKEDFEKQWTNNTKQYKNDWKKYTDGLENSTILSAKVKCFYPTGTIVNIGNHLGIIKGHIDANIGDKVFCKVIGLDNVNMWLELAISDIAMTITMYKKYNQPTMIDSKIDDKVTKYLEESNMVLKEGQMFIYGWVEHDFNLNDVLITKNNTKLYIETFTPFYSHILDSVYSGMRHGIICNVVDEEFVNGEHIRLL